MAYFRCGGGGIPATLKTDMNSVLNKKFGTISQDYPPNEWADDVNLLGKLPEKTASGSIAHFTDGADTVPLKSCTLTLAPTQTGTGDPSPTNPRPITGVSSVNVTNGGANFYNSGVEMGNISATGENTDNLNPNRARTINKIPVSANTEYTVGQKENYQIGLFFYNSSGTFLSFVTWGATPRTFTTPANTAFIRFAYQTATNVLPTEMQIVEGSQLPTYSAPTLTPVSLGQTVYGGEVECVGGEVTKTGEIVSFVGADSENWALTGSGDNRRFRISITSLGANSLLLSSHFVNKDSNVGVWGEARIVSNYLQLMDNTEQIADVPALKTWLAANQPQFVYELATPTTAQITPVTVNTLKGKQKIENSKKFEFSLKYPIMVSGSCEISKQFMPIFYPSGKD